MMFKAELSFFEEKEMKNIVWYMFFVSCSIGDSEWQYPNKTHRYSRRFEIQNSAGLVLHTSYGRRNHMSVLFPGFVNGDVSQ